MRNNGESVNLQLTLDVVTWFEFNLAMIVDMARLFSTFLVVQVIKELVK